MRFTCSMCALAAALLTAGAADGATDPPPSAEAVALGPARPFTVEGYYKIRWGHQDEFLALFEKITEEQLHQGFAILDGALDITDEAFEG